MRIKSYLGLLAMAVANVAGAQSFDTLAGDFAMIGVQHRAMESALGIDTTRATAKRPTTSRRPADRSPVFGDAAPAFPYRSTPVQRRASEQAYVARVARTNPAAARSTAAEMAKHDFDQVFTGLIAGSGLRTGDAADAVAAYTLLGWMIATGAPDPTPKQARAVRTQIARHAAGNATFLNPTRRADLGEEMKLLFVTVHAGWQSARKEGRLPQYSAGVARLFLSSGIDFAALRLTDDGFVARVS
jgi:hypothetical protein